MEDKRIEDNFEYIYNYLDKAYGINLSDAVNDYPLDESSKNIEDELLWITEFANNDYFRQNIQNESFIDNRNNEKLQLITSNRNYYFISDKDFDNVVIKPSIPDNFFTRNGYEDNRTARICFSTSIAKCLTALSMNVKNMEFNVYIPDGNKYKVYKPDISIVPDVEITDEVWILEPVKLKKIGRIICTGDDGKDGMDFKYGNNTATLYGWNYKWIENTLFIDKSMIRELSRGDVTNPYFVKWLFQEDEFKDDKPEEFNFDILIHNNQNNFVYGYFIDNKLEGFIRIHKINNNVFNISMLFVNKNMHNKGIGQSLFNFILQEFGKYKLLLSVFTWNKKAVYIYEKYGFKIITTKTTEDGSKMYEMERMPDTSFNEAFNMRKDFLAIGDNGENTTYSNPSKRQALNELYLRENDIINLLKIKRNEFLSDIEFNKDHEVQLESNNLKIIRNDIDMIENGDYSSDIMNKYRKYEEGVNSNLSGKQLWDYDLYMTCRHYKTKLDEDDILNTSINEATITSDKNGVNRKKLYIAFIEYAKSINGKNTFGSLFDKDVFKKTYPFIPDELRFFYRISNPVLCVLKDDLTFFQVSELEKINTDNPDISKLFIFAATKEYLVVFNIQDKKIYKALEEEKNIKLQNILSNTFDLYIQSMIGKGDILSGKVTEEDKQKEEEHKDEKIVEEKFIPYNNLFKK